MLPLKASDFFDFLCISFTVTLCLSLQLQTSTRKLKISTVNIKLCFTTLLHSPFVNIRRAELNFTTFSWLTLCHSG